MFGTGRVKYIAEFYSRLSIVRKLEMSMLVWLILMSGVTIVVQQATIREIFGCGFQDV
jgi:hypothetical protein